MGAQIAKPRLKPTAEALYGGSYMMSAHHAASRSDRSMATWNPPAGSADADLIDELDVIVPRSRDLVRNNGLASGAIQTLKDNIVGSVLRLSAKPDSRLLGWEKEHSAEWVKEVEAQFRTWAETTECDAGRTMTLLGLTTQALGSALFNGEALAIPHWLPRNDARWSSRLMLIEADRLATPPGMEHLDTIRGGIEVDQYGAPAAYWIQKTHPGDRYSMTWTPSPDQWERIPAFTAWGRRRVVHLHDKERTGQSRGKPILTSVMREFRMAGHYETTELQAAVSNSLIAAFIESDLDQESVAQLFSSGADRNPESYWRSQHQEYQTTLKGGAVIPLPIGAKLSGFQPGRPNAAFEGFMYAVLRHIAAGLNIPYELLTKDFSQTNYSSARAALLEAWRFFIGRRRWIKEYWLDPIYELWLEEAVQLGRIEAPSFYEHRYAYSRCRWIHAGRGWVDPVKEANAAKIRMDAGLSTLEMECAEQGQDWEEVIEQRAREKQAIADSGLSEHDPVTDEEILAMEEEDKKLEDKKR